MDEGVIKTDPIRDHVAAISCGVVQWTRLVLDLDYEEDSSAEADANFVLTSAGDIVEIQATGEKRGFTRPRSSSSCSPWRKGGSWIAEPGHLSCRRRRSPDASRGMAKQVKTTALALTMQTGCIQPARFGGQRAHPETAGRPRCVATRRRRRHCCDLQADGIGRIVGAAGPPSPPTHAQHLARGPSFRMRKLGVPLLTSSRPWTAKQGALARGIAGHPACGLICEKHAAE